MNAKSLVASILCFALWIFSSASFAATEAAQSITYFDSSGNVIGNQYLDCNNDAAHAGTLSSPYMVAQRWICPLFSKTCVWNGTSEQCIGTSASTIYKNVAYISTADGISPEQFCTDQVPGNVYAPTLSCNATGPSMLIGVGLDYSAGWD